MTTALPARHRQASNITEGYELQYDDGTWIAVTGSLHILAPMNFVSFDLADGTKANFPPKARIMSRRPATEDNPA